MIEQWGVVGLGEIGYKPSNMQDFSEPCGTRVSPAGTLLEANARQILAGNVEAYALAWANGHYVLAFRRFPSTVVTRLDRDGTPLGDPPQPLDLDGFGLSLAVRGDDAIVITGDNRVIGRRFDPATLALLGPTFTI